MKTKLLFSLGFLLALAGTARAQGTAFTYQGRLSNNGANANGNYDFAFQVFDAPSGGTSQSTTLAMNGVPVFDGLFVVTLDFGVSPFGAGAPRWLEVQVRTNGAGVFIPLAQRQAFSSSPYAITAGTLTGPVGAASLSGTYTNAITLSNTNNQFAGSYSGNGGGLTNVNAATLGGLSASGLTNAVLAFSDAGVVYPWQFGAKGDAVVDFSHGYGRQQAVGGSDDGPAFNALFNAITNGPAGTIVDGQNKIYFIATPMWLTNAGGGPLKLRNIGFAGTDPNYVMLTTMIGQLDVDSVTFIGTTNAETSCAVSNYPGTVQTDYPELSTWRRVIFKGGFGTDMIHQYQDNLEFDRCAFGNFRNKGLFLAGCDQVLVKNCVGGYQFDPYGGALDHEIGGGGNPAWVNGTTYFILGGISTMFLNCENYVSGSLLRATGATITMIGCDWEQFYAPINQPVCWLTRSTIVCLGRVNFINNSPGISNNLTTWKLDGCNLNASVINGGPVTTVVPAIDIVSEGQPPNSHLLPYIQWNSPSAKARVHATPADAGTPGTDYDVQYGNVVSASEANTFIREQVFTNTLAVRNGGHAVIQLGGDIAGNGLATADTPKGFEIASPSYHGTNADVAMLGGYSQGPGNTHLILGGGNQASAGANDIWFEVGGAAGLAGIWDPGGLHPYPLNGATPNLGTPSNPWNTTYMTNFAVRSNSYPITAWSALGNCGCVTWMSNATLYLICTNSIDGTATTNKLGGL